MFKPALGAIAGYLAMFAVVFAGLTALYLALGTERAFRPESFEPSMLWVAVMAVVGLVAALVGGAVAQRIGDGPAVRGLVGLVVILGALSVYMESQKEVPSEPRGPELSSMEAMQQAHTPLWVSILNPIIGVIGVGLGAKRQSKRQA